MSKAFKYELDTAEDEDAPDPAPNPLASGKNYITPQGMQTLRDEYDQLLTIERPQVVETVSWAAGNGDRSENGDYIYGKKRLREIDRRLRFLSQRLKAAVVVDPRDQTDRSRVFFGARVTYADEAGRERSITIVGEDEVDARQGHVSLRSPIARALLKARIGDVVSLVTPAGMQEVEIIAISYGA